MSEAALLFANEAFYAAFARRDIEAMEEVWSRNATLACIHPGWDLLVGRELVMATWRAILSGPQPPVTFDNAQAVIWGETGLVACHEHVEGAALIASNLFVREGKIWKMVHHQSGPLPTG
jgi:hypothetical protein